MPTRKIIQCVGCDLKSNAIATVVHSSRHSRSSAHKSFAYVYDGLCLDQCQITRIIRLGDGIVIDGCLTASPKQKTSRDELQEASISKSNSMLTDRKSFGALSSRNATTPLAECKNNDELIDLWLHGKSPHSQRAYRQDLSCFLAFVEMKPLPQVTLNDVQAFASAMSAQGYSSNTMARRLAALKSLLNYGYRIGVLPVNVGAPLTAPKGKETLTEKILSESQVLTAIALTQNVRDRVLIRFLYATGCRVSELCQLKWRSLREAGNGCGQVTLFGKGRKTRTVIFSAETWGLIQSLRGDAGADDPVFASRKAGGHLDPSHVRKIVVAAANRAGIQGKVSPHWLRHSHASHALERGTPISLVQQTLGHASIATTGVYLHARPTDSSALHLPV